MLPTLPVDPSFVANLQSNGIVFCCYPQGESFVDIISGQSISAATITSVNTATPDGNQATATYASNPAPLAFTAQTLLDAVAGPFTLFADAYEGVHGIGGKIFSSYETVAGHGVDLRFDDGATAWDSFDLYCGNSTVWGAFNPAPNHALVGAVGNNNSYAYPRRMAISMDASGNVNWYSLNALQQTKAWGVAHLPAGAPTRKTSVTNNPNHKIGLLIAFNYDISLATYQALYQDPVAFIQSAGTNTGSVPVVTPPVVTPPVVTPPPVTPPVTPPSTTAAPPPVFQPVPAGYISLTFGIADPYVPSDGVASTGYGTPNGVVKWNGYTVYDSATYTHLEKGDLRIANGHEGFARPSYCNATNTGPGPYYYQTQGPTDDAGIFSDSLPYQPVTLSRISGGLFDLASIDIAPLPYYVPNYGTHVTVDFVGTFADGTTVTETVSINQAGYVTCALQHMIGVVSVTWQGHGSPYYQFSYLLVKQY